MGRSQVINDYFYSLVLVALLILIIAGHIVLYILTKKKETLLYLFGYAVFFTDELFRMAFGVFGGAHSALTEEALQLCMALLMTSWLFFMTKAKSGKRISKAEAEGISVILVCILVFRILGKNEMFRLLVYIWVPFTMFSERNRNRETSIYFYTGIVMALLQSANSAEQLIRRGVYPFYSFNIWSEMILYCFLFIGITYVWMGVRKLRTPPVKMSKEQKNLEFAEKYGLSAREKEVLDLLIAGKSNAEIAERLYVSEGTVKSHVHSIYKKAGIKSRSMLHALLNGVKE